MLSMNQRRTQWPLREKSTFGTLLWYSRSFTVQWVERRSWKLENPWDTSIFYVRCRCGFIGLICIRDIVVVWPMEKKVVEGACEAGSSSFGLGPSVSVEFWGPLSSLPELLLTTIAAAVIGTDPCKGFLCSVCVPTWASSPVSSKGLQSSFKNQRPSFKECKGKYQDSSLNQRGENEKVN